MMKTLRYHRVRGLTDGALMGLFDWFFGGREKLLDSKEPERAFAPDPSADVWQLATGATNDKAFAQLQEQGVSLLRVNSGEAVSLSAFPSGVLLFATVWEPYSAKTIGAMKKAIDAGNGKPFGIVFFENSRQEVVETKQASWYFSQAYVLAPESASLRELIGRVPFHVFVSADGKVERIVEGKA
jgi:hypothetical protein